MAHRELSSPRFVQFLVVQRCSEIAVRHAVIGIKGYRPPIIVDRFGEPVCFLQAVAEVQMSLREVDSGNPRSISVIAD
jgi:hypothetical protein